MWHPGTTSLYRPEYEHGSSGAVFVVDMHGRNSLGIVYETVGALATLECRGAVGAEHNTGDGAGILIQIPDRFLMGRNALLAPVRPTGNAQR